MGKRGVREPELRRYRLEITIVDQSGVRIERSAELEAVGTPSQWSSAELDVWAGVAAKATREALEADATREALGAPRAATRPAPGIKALPEAWSGPCQDVVADLEALLEEARRGELRGFVYAGIRRGDGPQCVCSGANVGDGRWGDLLQGWEIAKARIMDALRGLSWS